MGKRILSLLLIVAVFAAFNFSMYRLLTVRLSNNFSNTSQAKMIDVAAFLPHEEASDLVRADTDLALTGELPVLDGAAALVPVYASVIHSLYPKGSVTYEGGVFSDDNFYGENFAPDSKMQYHNTVRGFTAVVDGETDIFFTAAPSEEQRGYAAGQGVELVYVPVGLEAFVFFVNASNPVENLTVEQVRSIYDGTYRSWADVGGPRRAINPVTRLAGSGSQSTMERFMGDREIAPKSPLALIGGSIGYSFRFYSTEMVGNDQIKLLSINGVAPTRENIINGTYPIAGDFYAVTTQNSDPRCAEFIEWILSDEGQELIEKTGYVGVSGETQ